MPHNKDRERAVLGAILLEQDKLEEVLDQLPSAEVFYEPAHGQVFGAVKAIFEGGGKVDLLTVAAQLEKEGHTPPESSWSYAMVQLTRDVVSSGHVNAWARLLIEDYLRREEIRVGMQLVAAGYDETVDVFDGLDQAQQEMFRLTTVGIKKDFVPISSVTMQVMMTMDEQREQGVEFTGLPTPWQSLDAVTGGWQKKNLIIVAARPSVGKTAVALQLAIACARDRMHGGAAAIFSLEMGNEELDQRMLAYQSGVVLDRIKKPWLQTDDDQKLITTGATELGQMPIFLDDSPQLGLTELRAKARRLKKKHGVQLIIIDYLQLMQGDAGSGNREQEVSRISRGLKVLAKDLDIPIIALSQLNRSAEQRKDNAPQLGDLRESGAIEQDADLVLLLSVPTKESVQKDPKLAGTALMNVAKNRNGKTADLTFRIDNAVQRWTELDGGMVGNWRPLRTNEIPKQSYSPAPSQPQSGHDDDLPF